MCLFSLRLVVGLHEGATLSAEVRPCLKLLYHSLIRVFSYGIINKGLLNLLDGLSVSIIKLLLKLDVRSSCQRTSHPKDFCLRGISFGKNEAGYFLNAFRKYRYASHHKEGGWLQFKLIAWVHRWIKVCIGPDSSPKLPSRIQWKVSSKTAGGDQLQWMAKVSIQGMPIMGFTILVWIQFSFS